ncbi:MAG: DUF2520 domain-containing protein [Bacteroidetes bacterium]|nr:DUF2520 domain-containing protein [Bacteroidota bacterium]MBK9046359.1 DUF2520 domain-containing protein [Bacteroidota bacterium]MBK9424949.1 DUF2520 domain-containing protein [Bacteroidota bacterium]
MKIYIIGTGKVATLLGKMLVKCGHRPLGISGRNEKIVNSLSKLLGCQSYHSITDLPANGDIYFIAVKDDAIGIVSKSLKHVKGALIHTSGATPLTTIGRKTGAGVFYPVSTIRENFPKSLKKVPLCLEATDEATMKKLGILATALSNKIYLLDSGERARLHLAAVFTNNFTNHLLGIAMNLLDEKHLPAELLEYLAVSTVRNAFENGAIESQTGPAVRNDTRTIQRQLKALKSDKQAYEIYKLITNQLLRVHKKPKI